LTLGWETASLAHTFFVPPISRLLTSHPVTHPQPVLPSPILLTLNFNIVLPNPDSPYDVG
jgi:hypothetical protein